MQEAKTERPALLIDGYRVNSSALIWLREQLGISQAEAARRVGAGGSAWYRWEAGTHRPRPVYVPAIRTLYDQASAAAA